MEENYQTNDEQENTFNGEVPQEIKKWNWGAFSLNIYWAIGNKTYLPLLCLIPVFNLVWVFICGAKGNEWAWRNGEHDLATFKAIQETWNRAGFIMFIIQIIAFVAVFFFYFLVIATALSMYKY